MVILRPGFFTLDPAVGMPARKRGRAGGGGKIFRRLQIREFLARQKKEEMGEFDQSDKEFRTHESLSSSLPLPPPPLFQSSRPKIRKERSVMG